MSNKINNRITLTEFISLRDLENIIYNIFEGVLDFNKRKVQVTIIGEKEGIKFYRSLFNDNNGWIPKFNNNSNTLETIDYWIAPNAIVVYPKILKDE